MPATLGDRIIAEALTWVGTPFHEQADVKGVGVDCVFFYARTYQAVGVVPLDWPDPRPYPSGRYREGIGTRYRDELLIPYFDELPSGTCPERGDGVLYKMLAAEVHGVIVVDWPRVIHAHPQLGVIEDFADRNSLAALTLTSVWRPRG